MNKKTEKVLLFGVAAFFLLVMFPNLLMGQSGLPLLAAEDLIIGFEGWIPISRWDNKQYSWGYGTAAPGPGLSITEAQARAELRDHVQADYNYLSRLITVSLNANQWAALLSFSYNEGQGNADNLVANINAEDWDALGVQWKKYVYYHDAAGVAHVSQDLVDRRAAEWEYFNS